MEINVDFDVGNSLNCIRAFLFMTVGEFSLWSCLVLGFVCN